MQRARLLVWLLVLVPAPLVAQADSAAARCTAQADAPADATLPVDWEPEPKGVPYSGNDAPKDAVGQTIVARFVVTAAGRVDTSTIAVTGTEDAKWLARFRRELGRTRFEPAQLGHCAIARAVTFSYRVIHH